MEYEFYVESKYKTNGELKTRILSAAEAERLGYEDGYKEIRSSCTIYADGFSSKESAENYINSLN